MKKVTIKSMMMLACVACMTWSCSNDDGTDEGGNGGNGTDNAIETRLETFREHTNNFALNFFQAMNEDKSGESFVVSPISVAYTLGMTYEGAAGQTREEIQRALGIGQEDVSVSEAFKTIMTGAATADPDVKLALANGIFVNSGKGFRLFPAYQQTVSQAYDAAVMGLDFGNEEATMDAINGWASQHTNGLITDMVKPGMIRADASVCIGNSTYLLAPWQHPFDRQLSQEDTFVKADGEEVLLPFMVQDGTFSVSEGDGYRAVTLPYANGKYEMVAVVPTKGGVDDLIASVDGAWMEKMLEGMSEHKNVHLMLPHFTTSTEVDLGAVLTALGITSIFSSDADIPGICQDVNVKVDKVLQNAKIFVTEDGTEAAAVTLETAVGVDLGSQPYTFRADRPFFYLIRQKETGSIFFMGKFVGDRS